MKAKTWRMAVIVTFCVVFALTLVLAIGGIWDTSGDQATKGLARFYGILMLPCLAAARDAYHLVLKAAIEHGASPDTVSAEGRPLLFEALAFNAEENVGLIVEKGARLDVRDDEKRSALVRAIFLRMWPQARLMVERGVPIADPPGYFNLVNVLSETHPPEEGTPEREEFRGLLKALAARGINLPERK